MSEQSFTPLLEQIKARLLAAKGEWPQISEKTSLSYWTIANVATGKSPNPTNDTLQPLADYFGIVAVPRAAVAVA